MDNPGDQSLPQLPITHTDVPVFDCHVILSPPNDKGVIIGRVSSLEGIVAEANNERDLLRKIVDQFKATIQRYHNQGQPIPWRDPAEKASAGEQERWIPVHL